MQPDALIHTSVATTPPWFLQAPLPKGKLRPGHLPMGSSAWGKNWSSPAFIAHPTFFPPLAVTSIYLVVYLVMSTQLHSKENALLAVTPSLFGVPALSIHSPKGKTDHGDAWVDHPSSTQFPSCPTSSTKWSGDSSCCQLVSGHKSPKGQWDPCLSLWQKQQHALFSRIQFGHKRELQPNMCSMIPFSHEV